MESDEFEEQLAALRSELTRLLDAVEDAGRAERLLCGVATASEALLATRDLDQGMRLSVRVMGDVAEVDRISVFERHVAASGEEQFRRRVAHTRAGVDARALDSLAPLSPLALHVESWREDLFRGRSVRACATELSGPVRKLLDRAGVRSLLLAPIEVEETNWGFIGFYDLRAEHRWTNGEECVLLTLASALGAAVELHRNQRRRLELERRLLRTHRLESLALLAGGVAHDMNNLLTAVQTLRSTRISKRADSQIDEAVERLADLADQLLLYAGDRPTRRAPVKMRDLVRNTARLLRPSLPRGIEMDTHDVAEVPAIIGDPTQLRQIIMNLVVNASEAVEPPGAIHLGLGVDDVDETILSQGYHGTSASAGPHVVLEISDNGRGVDPQSLVRIIDPFFTTKEDGSGLGLATVMGVTRAHRGVLSIESSIGEGTLVRVYLPLSRL